MSGTQRGFSVIGERDAPTPTPTPAPVPVDAEATKRNTEMLLLALRALSQRAVTAITNLFSLLLVLSVWVLAMHVLDNPSTGQLIALAGYAVFVLAIDVVRRRSKGDTL